MIFKGRARALVCLLLSLQMAAPGALAQASAPQNTADPAALVKSIVINGQSQTDANSSQAVVTRAADGVAVPLSNGLILYRGDVIETLANTKVTILFLDEPVSERGNEVIIDADSRVGIWAKVKNAFNSRTDYVRLGAKGTEYEFRVFKGEQRATVVVLEDFVEITKGSFTPVALGHGINPAPESVDLEASPTLSAAASFAHAPFVQVQFGRTLEAEAGKITSFDVTYHIANNCGQSHHFEFRTRSDGDWLQIEVANNITVVPRATNPVDTVVRIDARSLSPGQYLGRIYAICLDCSSERGQCIEGRLEWPIKLTVSGLTPTPTPTSTTTPTPTPTTTPTPTPTPTPIEKQNPFLVRELEASTLTVGVDRPQTAPVDQVLSVLGWTNNVILPAQPTYSARNLIPHFNTLEQRSQNFRSARQSAILERNPAGSNRILGDVYNDWGAGAQAVRAYEKESSLNSVRRREAAFAADLAEAYRLTGQLSRAQESLAEDLGVDQRSTPVLNARGNLSLDSADIALDKGDANQAKAELAKAQAFYQAALQGQQTQPSAGARSGPTESASTIQTNLAEVNSSGGYIAQREGDLQTAKSRYEASAQLLNSARQANPQYPFALTELGRAYQRLGNVAQLEGSQDEARAAYTRAESQYRQAIVSHPDMAEAFFHLGDLFEDEGNPAAAKENYQRAIKARPEQPESYYSLALLLQGENPQLAAALAAVYLKLLPAVFQHGEKARNAKLIRQGVPIQPPKRPIGSTESELITVPNLVNRTRADALQAINVAGLIAGNVEKRGGSNAPDTVIEQKPAAGAKARRRSSIDLVLGTNRTPQPVQVPGVRNDKLETARRKITEKGLTVGQISERVSCESIGKVLEQNPKGGTKVDPGSPVDITIGSVGEDAATVPNLIGHSQEEAETIIQRIGLRVGRVRREPNSASAGTVLSQKPDAGTRLARECSVEFSFAIPIPDVKVDNYVGMTSREAQVLLALKGLSWNIKRQAAREARGRVIAQEPQHGTLVRPGFSVSLTVSEGQPDGPNDDGVSRRSVPVPNVMNKPKGEAENLIRQLGLVPRVIVPRGTDCSEAVCHVYRQEPAANTQVLVGTEVTVWVRPPYYGVPGPGR
jgi:beta-lactam-binding protein with PASTA domain